MARRKYAKIKMFIVLTAILACIFTPVLPLLPMPVNAEHAGFFEIHHHDCDCEMDKHCANDGAAASISGYSSRCHTHVSGLYMTVPAVFAEDAPMYSANAALLYSERFLLCDTIYEIFKPPE